MISVDLEKNIENAWKDRTLVHNNEIKKSIECVIENLDKGILRVASHMNGCWKLNDWVRKAVLLYFSIKENKKMIAGDMEFYDKVKLKKAHEMTGIRVVPPAAIRYGAFINKGAVIMPSYINIGAYIDSRSMIDIGAAIGSCAQIGKYAHISAGAIIGGVLEPINTKPVIIEDRVFIGANTTIVEGITVCEGSVIGAGVCITGSTKIIDTESGEVLDKVIPPNSVVIPGTREKQINGEKYGIPCALVIGKKRANTEAKVAINEALR